MSTIEEFIKHLHAAGVVIEGRQALIEAAHKAADWTDVVTDLARQRHRAGVKLLRHAADSPSDHHLDHLLQAYPFTDLQRRLVVQNVVVRP